MLGDLLTTVQENLPVKICVYDNAKLGFVEIEQKTEGLLPTFTENRNPDFGAVARGDGAYGARRCPIPRPRKKRWQNGWRSRALPC